MGIYEAFLIHGVRRQIVFVIAAVGLILFQNSCAYGVMSWDDYRAERFSYKLSLHSPAPFDLVRGMMVIEGDHLNIDDPVLLVFDTGSFQNLWNSAHFDSALYELMDDSVWLRSSGWWRSQPYVSNPIRVEPLRLNGFSGEAHGGQLVDFPESVLPRLLDGRKLLGVIGIKSFGHQPFIIDYDNEVIRPAFGKEPELSQNLENLYGTLGLSRRESDMRVPVESTVEGKEVVALLDTGMNIGLLSFSDSEALKENNPERWLERVDDSGATERIGLIGGLTFGGTRLSDEIFRSVRSSDLRSGQITIGNWIMRRFNWLIDLENDVITAEKYSSNGSRNCSDSIGYPERFDTPGFDIRIEVSPIDVSVHVSSVWQRAGEPLAPGIEIGDRIVAVNGLPAEFFDWQKWELGEEKSIWFRRQQELLTENIQLVNLESVLRECQVN